MKESIAHHKDLRPRKEEDEHSRELGQRNAAAQTGRDTNLSTSFIVKRSEVLNKNIATKKLLKVEQAENLVKQNVQARS